MGVEIRRVESKADLGQFIELPYRLYRGDPYWVPQLRSELWKLLDRTKHPFHQHATVEYFLAADAGRVIGRIAAIDNRMHVEFQQEPCGFFGFFECEQRPDAAAALFDAATAWLRQRNLTVVRGPMSFSTNEECGLLTEGFDSSPVVMMTYNPPYYVDLIEGYGFRKAKNLYAYMVDKEVRVREAERFAKLERVAERARVRAGIEVRPANMKDFDGEIRRVKEVYNKAWVRNWGFVPMTDAEFDQLASDLKQVIVPELVLIAEVKGKPVACSLTLPDINPAFKAAGGNLFPFGLIRLLWAMRKIKTIRLLALGVIPEYLRSGVDSLLIARTYHEAVRLGYDNGELSWILEDNDLMNNAIQAFHGRLYKRYRIYELPLT